MACKFECKYSEISAGLKHNVDELLVGLVTQIKLKAEQETAKEGRDSKDTSHNSHHDKRRHSKTSLFLGNRTR